MAAQYDYFLYDNCTRGPGGYDWGLKRATGQLQQNQAAKEKFVKYTRDSFGTRGLPSGFGAALGCIPLDGGGYLLCVTLEIQDKFQRPSCAFVGIHCRDASALKTLLTQGDPVLSAKGLSEGTAVRSNTGRPSSHQGASPSSVTKILLEHIEKGGRPPSILGITDARQGQLLTGYNLVNRQGQGLLPNAEARFGASENSNTERRKYPSGMAASSRGPLRTFIHDVREAISSCIHKSPNSGAANMKKR